MPDPHRLLLLAYPEGQVLDICGPAQLFAAANRALGRAAYEVLLVGPEAGPLPSSAAFALHAALGHADVTPALLAGTGTVMATGGDAGLRAALADGGITRILRDAAAAGVPRLAAVCTGAFFLADAGLLDGRRAATHWNAAARLRRFRPAVEVDGESLWVRDGAIWTSAGVTAGMDLALAMLEADHGRDLALTLARHHVITRTRSGGQRQYAEELAGAGAEEPRLGRLAARIAAAPAEDWRIEAMAEAAACAPRSLTRLFRRHLGVSPAEFVERVRLDAARRLLLAGPAPVEAVARDSGFGTLRRMDRAFARLLNTTPREFRARFRTEGVFA